MLQSEIILHQKVRNLPQDFSSFGVEVFTLAAIPEEEMGFVLSQIPDRFFARKRELKRLFARESEYRIWKAKSCVNYDTDKKSQTEINEAVVRSVKKFMNFGENYSSTGRISLNIKTMKTILVVYSNTLPKPNERALKRYAFNTEDTLEEGDMIKSPNYDTNMVVVSVLDAHYKYFNANTGDLTNVFNNSKLFPIRTLKLVDNNEDIITAVKLAK